MLSRISMSKKSKKNILVLLSFMLITILFIFPFIKSQHYLLMADSSFQLSKANEIYKNLKQGDFFTFIATHCFSKSGVGTFLFYPSVFIYLLALLRFIFNPITSIWIWTGMFLFLTLLIAFYSMLSFSKGNHKRSYLFAVVYTIVPYHFYLMWNGTLGEFIAYTFLPLVFLGIYKILWENSNQWYFLALGITLICYSHVLSLYISIGFCMILFLIKLIFSSINKKQFANLIKSAGLAFALSFWEFVPFLTDYFGKNIATPSKGFNFLYSFNDLVTNSFTNVYNYSGRTSIGIFLILIMLGGWAFPKLQHNKRELMIYLLGSAIILCSTTFLAWQSFATNKLILNIFGMIQMTFRLLPYGSLLLSVTFSFIADSLFCNLLSRKEMLGLLSIFILIITGGYYGSIQNEIQTLHDSSSQMVLNKPKSKEKPIIGINKLVNSKNYNNIFKYQIIYGETDYYTKKALGQSKSIINNWTYINGKRVIIRKKASANKIEMIVKATEKSKANLPIINYHNTYVTDNGKKINHLISNRGTVEVNLNKGKNVIQIGYKPSIFYYISFIFSLLIWLILAFRVFMNYTDTKSSGI